MGTSAGVLWAQEFPELCWLPALPAWFESTLERVTAQGQTGAVTNHYSSASPGLPASLAGLWALLVTGRSLPMPLWLSLPVLFVAAGWGWGCLLGWEGWSCEKHLSLPRFSGKAHSSPISLSALHRSLQEKRTLPQRGFWHLGRVSASGGVGSSLSKGLLPPFCQHSSQTQPPQISPQLRVPSERWAGVPHALQDPGLDHHHSALCPTDPRKKPSGLRRLSWRVWGALPSLVTQFIVVPKPPAPNPWPAPPA